MSRNDKKSAKFNEHKGDSLKQTNCQPTVALWRQISYRLFTAMQQSQSGNGDYTAMPFAREL